LLLYFKFVIPTAQPQSDPKGAVNNHALLSGKVVRSSSDISPRDLFKEMSPDVVMATQNSHHDLMPAEFIDSAHREKIPSVLVQDFWGNHAHGSWGILPDLVCVQDCLGKELVLKTWPDMQHYQVVITGQPAFDNLISVDTAEANKKLREQFQLSEDWPIIHFSGGSYGMPEAIRITIDALNILKRPVYLFIRHHPTLTLPGASDDFKRIYREYHTMPEDLLVGQSITSDASISSDLINAGSDIVISMYSTQSVKACYLRKACISVLVSESRQNLEKATGGLLNEFPPVALGACWFGMTDWKVAECLGRIFEGDTGDMRKAQEEHFVTDGKSAERVLGATLKLVKIK